MPSRLTVTRPGKQTALLAQELLDKGILKPYDWTGDLADTVRVALTRWANVDLGCEHMTGQMRLYYTDNVQEMFPDIYSTHHWQTVYQDLPRLSLSLRADSGSAEAVLGGIGLMGGDMGEIVVGAKVEELEKVSPGFGFAVLHTAVCALEDACSLFSFKQAEQVAEMHGDGGTDGATDLSALSRHVPNGAFFEGGMHGFTGLEDKLKNPRRKLSRSARAVQELAVETWERSNRVGSRMNHLHSAWGFFATIPSCMIRWSQDDAMDALKDDCMEMMMQESEWTFWQYIAAWDWSDPATLGMALDHVRLSLLSCSTGWRLLCELHRDPRLTNVFKGTN